MILTTQEIIDTYNERHQRQSKLYFEYKTLKEQNPTFGYKRLSKLLREPTHRTRWWHHSGSIPQSIQTINWLKEKNLIPLTENNPLLPLIAKVLGTTFGDGGIFQNLNAIFLSSSELELVKEFGEDLNKIFGKEIEINSRVIEGGVYGHSWCYQNTNRGVIRFFQALGAHIGRKSNFNLIIPEWILKDRTLQDHFFGSFFGNEIGIPKIHKDNKRTNSLDLGLVCNKNKYQNRISFFSQIQTYLNSKGIKADNIYTRQHKDDKNKLLMRLTINLNFDNLMNFYKNMPLFYSNKKSKKLEKTIKELQDVKLRRFNELSTAINSLTKRNYSKEWIKHNLRLTDKSTNFILTKQPVEKWN